MPITQQDRKDWAQHPVTVELLESLRATKQETMEAWANEQYVGDSLEGTFGSNAKALGGVGMLEQVIQYMESFSQDEAVTEGSEQ